MNPLQRMRRAIRKQKYRISSHANEEMSEDGEKTNVYQPGGVGIHRKLDNNEGVKIKRQKPEPVDWTRILEGTITKISAITSLYILYLSRQQ